MTRKERTSSFEEFQKEQIKRQEIIVGGPTLSRGTETTVQETGG